MKICFNIGTLSYSGAEKIMFYLIKEFEKKGDEVSVILLSSKKYFDDLKNVKQFPIYGEYCDEKNKIFRTLKCHKIIRKIIKNNKFDLIISFGVIFNVELAEACLFNKTKIILCERNDPIHDPCSKLLRFRRMLSYLRGDAFVFQTKEIMNFFPKIIKKKSTIIPNFIEKEIKKNEIYKPIHNSFSTSARLDNRQKDQYTLINAFNIFLKSHPDYKLELYGDGPDRVVLESLVSKLDIQKNVFFKGRVSDPMKYIRFTKAFILTSVYEGMPNSLIEAMCYGMPCISSDCSGGGAKALIDNKKNGLLFSVGDIEELSKLMTRIADDDNFAASLGKNAYNINKTLNKDAIMCKWFDLISNIMSK